MTLNTIIYKGLFAILNLNARIYGRAASHELCRDLRGSFLEVTK